MLGKGLANRLGERLMRALLGMAMGFSVLVSAGAQASLMPIKGSEVAGSWDKLYIFLLWLSLFFFVLVIGGMIYYAIAYRKGALKKTKYVVGSHSLEFLFVTIPTILLMGIFVWGWIIYRDMVQPPVDAYEVTVIGKQWSWDFLYDNGRVETNRLYVPHGKAIKLKMTSQDVIHSFFIPNMRVKQDVVPGMYTSIWFEPSVAGTHHIFCTEYCGTSHSGMIAKLFVLNEAQWKDFNAGKKIPDPDWAEGSQAAEYVKVAANAPAQGEGAVQIPLVDQGRELFKNKGCTACHSADTAENKLGPSLKGIFGTEVELVNGEKVKVDDNYLRESIEVPSAKLVKGFQPVMTPFKGMLTEQELNALITYIKSNH